MNVRFIFLLSLLFVALPMLSQDISWQDFNEDRLRLNRVGMEVLGGWAIANIAISGVGVFQSAGVTKAYHQMNLGWNAVNLTLAGFGYFSALNGQTDLGTLESIQAHESIMRIFLFNAGLDVAYIMAGAYLIEKSKNVTKNSERLEGFGKSIILQGGFLLLFDGIMYFSHLNHGNSTLSKLISGFSFTPSGFYCTLNF